MNICIFKYLKDELAWDIDKRFQVTSYMMAFITVIPLKVKNKNILNFKKILYALLCSL